MVARLMLGASVLKNCYRVHRVSVAASLINLLLLERL